MDKNHAIALLREQIESIDSLKHTPPYNPEYKIWKNTTEKLIKESFDESYLHLFNRQGAFSIARNQIELMDRFVSKLDEHKDMLNGLIKEYERFNSDDSPLSQSFPDSFQKYSFHPEINSVSSQLLIDGHYSQAIEEALKKVIKRSKVLYKAKTGDDFDGDSLMNMMFGCENREPVIKFNNLSSREEKNEQKGIMNLFKGIVGIRNRKAHDNVLQSSYEKAIEYLALTSLLMRLLDDFS